MVGYYLVTTELVRFLQTAVHHAVLNRDSQSLQALLNQGGDLHQLDIQQKTPWDYVKGDMHCEKMVCALCTW